MRVALMILALVAFAGCDDQALPPPATTAAPTASGSVGPVGSASARPKRPSYDESQLHVPADYEQKAEDAINAQNYEAALKELHQEITGKPMEGDEHDHEGKPATTGAPAATGAP